MQTIGSLVEDRYEVQTLLHSTKETYVYSAADRVNGAPVVVKLFLKGNYLAEMYFAREVQFYKGCVGIAGIPALLATGHLEGQNYLIVDFVGRSLSDIIATGRSISMSSMPELARRLLVILQTIHRRDFLHLSVSPDNILIDLETSHVSLIDFKFSINLADPQESNDVAQRASKLLFTSSDQLHGQTPSFRSDLESLAYVLMYLQTGSLPWRSALRTESHSKYLHSRRRFSHSEFLRDVPDEYRELWTAATRIQPGERPNYERIKATFLTTNDKIHLEDRGRRDYFHAATRGTSLGVSGTDFHISNNARLDDQEASEHPPPSPQRDEARKTTAKKEGPQFTPSLRSLISHIREDY